MVLNSKGPLGRAVVVPCRMPLSTPLDLITEAEELWKAEQPTAAVAAIGASWGCVGALFRDPQVHAEWVESWRDHFQRKVTKPISPVMHDGQLQIPWPGDTRFDVLVATATKADDESPSATEIADAWVYQDGDHERYFFENVKHGIRTPDDTIIWQRIEQAKPGWLQAGAYEEAVTLLKRDPAD